MTSHKYKLANAISGLYGEIFTLEIDAIDAREAEIKELLDQQVEILLIENPDKDIAWATEMADAKLRDEITIEEI